MVIGSRALLGGLGQLQASWRSYGLFVMGFNFAYKFTFKLFILNWILKPLLMPSIRKPILTLLYLLLWTTADTWFPGFPKHGLDIFTKRQTDVQIS